MKAGIKRMVYGAGLFGGLIFLGGCNGFFVPQTTTTPCTTSCPVTGVANFVYVANAATNTISGFAVGTGTLTSVPNMPFALGFTPQGAVVTRSNAYLYVAGPGAVYVYTINSDGSLTSSGSGAGVAVVSASSLDVSPDGQWLFALDQFNSAVDVYQLASTGAITLAQQVPYAASTGLVLQKMVRVSPDGTLVFAALGTGGIAAYSFNTSSGLLALVAMLPPISGTTSDNALAVDSTSTHLYVAKSGTNGGLWVYTIGSGGSLASITGSPFAAGAQPLSVLLDSTGKYVYVANGGGNSISGYSIGTTGAPTALLGSPYASGSSVRSLARDSSGTYILAVATAGSPDLTMYSFDATTAGKLDSVATAASGVDPAGAILVAATHP